MSADGAHFGITPSRAIETIIGGKPAPTEEDAMDAATFCAWIRSAPERASASLAGTGDGYTECGRITARYILLLLDEQPSAISLDSWDLIKRVDVRFPEARETTKELTWFLAGWAVNAARRCVEMPPVGNPAILTVRTPD